MDLTFSTSAIDVPSRTMTKLPLGPGVADGPVRCVDGALEFCDVGWFEVLLQVAWDADDVAGTRFAHSKIPGQQPLHSEAIDAHVLSQISDGRQLLRGNTIFGLDHTRQLVLEVWHDSPRPVRVEEAELTVRSLALP